MRGQALVHLERGIQPERHEIARSEIGCSNIRNYSIFLREPENVLFAYFEYHGSDFAADMTAMADDPETQRWWAIMKPMHAPLETRAEGEWWAPMEEVFYVP